MPALTPRSWVPTSLEQHIQVLAQTTQTSTSNDIDAQLLKLAKDNVRTHSKDCFNLNPATNAMNPRAEDLLSAGIGNRPSLGYPGDKYEMGLEAIEEIEVIAAELAAEVFCAEFAEIRVASGAMANLYGFMATCKPGDTIIVPPPSIGGHVTHHDQGCAGLFGLKVEFAPVNADGYTIDLERLKKLALKVNPKLITIGGSLNLFPHPVNEIRDIADSVGAKVLFDAAHQCGIIAGKSWPNPLQQGAHLMTMSTYKSLGGPAGGLIVSNDAEISEKLDQIAFPGMTANFDAAKSAALAMTLLDWREYGEAYAQEMMQTSNALASALYAEGLPVFAQPKNFTESHQFAIEANQFGGGQTLSKKLRQAGFLACGIGLPVEEVPNDMNGLRIGTPELVRYGVTVKDTPKLAKLIARACNEAQPEILANEVAAYRQTFNKLHFIRS